MSMTFQEDLSIRTTEEILSYLRKIAIETLKLDSEHISRIQPDSPLFETLLLDSLSAVEIMFEIEEYYGIQFEPEDMMRVKTIKDLVGLIQGQTFMS
jgi:acyl carrier protein